MKKFSLIAAIGLIFSVSAYAQAPRQVVQMAKIVVDPVHLESYKALLKEEIETAVKGEPGVLTLNAVYDKAQPNHVTVLGIYSTEQAYYAYLESSHYQKYKNGTRDMVRSVEVINMEPAAVESKSKK